MVIFTRPKIPIVFYKFEGAENDGQIGFWLEIGDFPQSGLKGSKSRCFGLIDSPLMFTSPSRRTLILGSFETLFYVLQLSIGLLEKNIFVIEMCIIQ
jgi:hypothetical protein